MLKRLKKLEVENARYKQMYAEGELEDSVAIGKPWGKKQQRHLRAAYRQALGEKAAAPSARRKKVKRNQSRSALEHCLRLRGVQHKQAVLLLPAQARLCNKVIASWLIRQTTALKRMRFKLCTYFLANVKGFSWNYQRIHRSLELNLRIF